MGQKGAACFANERLTLRDFWRRQRHGDAVGRTAEGKECRSCFGPCQRKEEGSKGTMSGLLMAPVGCGALCHYAVTMLCHELLFAD